MAATDQAQARAATRGLPNNTTYAPKSSAPDQCGRMHDGETAEHCTWALLAGLRTCAGCALAVAGWMGVRP